MTRGETLALAGGGALMVAGGVALLLLRRRQAAPSSPSPSSSSTLSAQQVQQLEAIVKASGISLYDLAHAPVGYLFNGQRYEAAQRAAATLWLAGIRSIPGYTGANVIGQPPGESGIPSTATGGCTTVYNGPASGLPHYGTCPNPAVGTCILGGTWRYLGGNAWLALPGATLSVLANWLGVSLQALLDANTQITDANRIYAYETVVVCPGSL